MRLRIRRGTLGCLVTILLIAAVLAGCGNKQTGETLGGPAPILVLYPTAQPKVPPTIQPTVRPTPTMVVLGPLIQSSLDIRAGPVDVPIELQIPSLKVTAAVRGVGLTSENVMDSPKGPIGDPVWHTAFWYRGSGIPGEPGTATIAGHVDDPLGEPEIFAHLQDLHAGDQILIHYTASNIDVRFIVDQIKIYSIQESSDPSVLTQIYGAGPVAGTGPQPSLDGLSHLTLITCAGNFVNGQYDHHTVIYATRGN